MNIAIYIYPEAEVLDFSGPFEVLSTAKRLAQLDWNIFFVAENTDIVQARGNMLVQPHYSIDNHPPIDHLIVVGGVHNNQLEKINVIDWIREVDEHSISTNSICTGVFLLAKAGLLNSLTVTTHWQDIKELQASFPQLKVISNKRWVQSEKYISSGGISAGIDMSLYLLSTLTTQQLAEQTAKQMEYQWQQQE